jgi:hypothetical protein
MCRDRDVYMYKNNICWSYGLTKVLLVLSFPIILAGVVMLLFYRIRKAQLNYPSPHPPAQPTLYSLPS